MGRKGHPLRVSVIGTGYLGLTHAVCMADLGHEVLGIDVDAEKLAKAARGEAPFFEPGLEPLLRKNLDAGRLRFTDSFAEIGEFGDVHFICVGTPQMKDGSGNADLSYVFGAADALAPHLTRATLVVGKSTVPVGTSRQVIDHLHAAAPAGDLVDFAFNPEFLREGYAVQDSLTPDRIVFGVTSAAAAELMRQVYAVPLDSGIPGLTMDIETAELVKVAANAFLATKISFINVMAEMCEVSGGDVLKLADAIGIDERIGRKFLSPGLGFGGGCLPKDIRAFRATAEEMGVTALVDLLTTVDGINLGRRERVLTLASEGNDAVPAAQVDGIDGGQQLDQRADALLGGREPEGADVLRQAAAAEAEPRREELAADPLVQADRVGQSDHVRAGRLAHLGHHVDEGDLGREE